MRIRYDETRRRRVSTIWARLRRAPNFLHSCAGEVESSRRNLLQLGVSEGVIAKLRIPEDINAYVTVSAPFAGTVLERKVNQGQVIAEGMELFQIALLRSESLRINPQQ